MSTVPVATEDASCGERFRILSLDGGGAKGFYTLGVLREIEAALGKPLCEGFDLVFGTSTGAIIAALIALGKSVNDIHDLYKEHVPTVMKPWGAWLKTRALANLATTIFEDAKFDDVKTNVGIVTTKWETERPMVFKGNKEQAHGRKETFVAGFGVPIADAVQASCSAYPFFKKKTVVTSTGNEVILVDGGFCANNPTLYAIADAIRALKKPRESLRVVSVGVGVFPTPSCLWPPKPHKKFISLWPSVRLLQKVLEINTQSMEQLRSILFGDVATVRISDTFDQPELATDFLEHNLKKLNKLRQRGADSYANQETDVKRMLFE